MQVVLIVLLATVAALDFRAIIKSRSAGREIAVYAAATLLAAAALISLGS